MSLLPLDISTIELPLIQQLVDNSIPETVTLEYKREPFEENQKLCKSVAAFANTRGGWLIIGIDETDGAAASALVPFTDNLDELRRKIDQVLQSGIEPAITGIQMKAVSHNGGSILVIRVPRSSYLPHRVRDKFYVRSDAPLVREAELQELRSMFNERNNGLSRARLFHQDRLKTVYGLHRQAHVNTPEGDGYLHINISPISFDPIFQSIDMKLAQDNVPNFLPMGSGYQPRFNPDGFVVYSPGTMNPSAYTQLFRSGDLESVVTDLITTRPDNGQRIVHARRLENSLRGKIEKYVQGLSLLGVTGPYVITISLLNVGGTKVICPNDDYQTGPFILRQSFTLPECVVESVEGASSFDSYMKPALDGFWNAGGEAEWTPVER